MTERTDRPRVRQCRTCPWRVNAKVSNIPGYSRELHEDLRRTIAEPGSVAGLSCGLHVMACHYSHYGAEVPCAGWLSHQLGPGNNVALRLAMVLGRMPVPTVDGAQRGSFSATLDDEDEEDDAS